MRVLLAAHRLRLAQLRLPAPRLLHQRSAALDHGELPRDFILQRRVDALEGVHVLDLNLRPKLLLSCGAHTDIHVRPHVPLFQVAVAHARIHEALFERLKIGHRLVRRGQIGLGHDLHQRRAAAVEIHSAEPGIVVDLRRILLQVNVVDADALRTGRRLDRHPAAQAERMRVLRDLIVLRHIRIKIVFPVKGAVAADRAPQHQAGEDRQPNRLAVHHRQRARIPHANRTHRGVGFLAEGQAAPAKHLGRRLELDMRLQTDGDQVLNHTNQDLSKSGKLCGWRIKAYVWYRFSLSHTLRIWFRVSTT